MLKMLFWLGVSIKLCVNNKIKVSFETQFELLVM